MKPFQRLGIFLFTLSFLALGACGSSTPNGDDDGNPTPTPTASPIPGLQALFTPVGAVLEGALIDLEFLPGQAGESLVAAKNGRVYYLDANFERVGSPFQVAAVIDEGERGLLSVAADPEYATSGLIYLYYTVDDGDDENPDVNRVQRFQVNVNVAGGTFSLTPLETIIEFSKTQASEPGSNHNGGALLFDNFGNLIIGVGDGGGDSSASVAEGISQDWTNSLGKIHRILPVPDGGEEYTIPDCQVIPGSGTGDEDDPCDETGTPTTVYSIGLRNPYTIVLDEDSDLFLGDVGANTFEELNCVYFFAENYGWPNCEGPCVPPIAGFQPPIHGFAHNDETFNNEDPAENREAGPQSIIVSAYYLGDAYGGQLTGKLIYNEFFDGWVRLLTLSPSDRVVGDQHLGHQGGLTGLSENPADGLLYGTSLGGSEHILRMDLAE